MFYDKFIDSALEYEQYSSTSESEVEFEFTTEQEYQAFIKSPGGFWASQLQGQIKAQTEEVPWNTQWNTPFYP